MIRIMILDDDEEKYRLYGNDIPECGMVSAGIE